ncbi:hypothetical protein BDY19DRAFT_994549 [Irpex rosettiformis]|uniref:Uncharacterized protein n=1 Tax=Irpex rosettiformis TaxID=378272 RepID=A0ACB8U1B9_9APHY|nr:hypothetical protein BDY19DRAFT_994549 [Irpex rosettiformis]
MANIAESISQLDTPSNTSFVYTIVHVWTFYVLYTCATLILGWATRDELSATVDALLSIQTYMMKQQNMPQDVYHGFLDRYTELQESVQNPYNVRWFNVSERICRVRANAKANKAAQQLLDDVKLSAINVISTQSPRGNIEEKRAECAGEDHLRGWNIRSSPLSSANFPPPMYHDHLNIEEGLEKDASADKFTGEFWV